MKTVILFVAVIMSATIGCVVGYKLGQGDANHIWHCVGVELAANFHNDRKQAWEDGYVARARDEKLFIRKQEAK